MSVGVLIAIAIVIVVAVLFTRASGNKAPAVARTPARVEGPKQHFLVGKGGELDGQAFHIGNRIATVGRAPSNYVQLNSPEVSRMAAQIDAKGDAPKVIDMNSAAGIRINGKPVNEGTLTEGDELQVGDQVFTYHLEGDFKKNAAFGAKAIGKEVAATTMDASANLAIRAQAAYALHKGDEEAAAKETGVTVEELRSLLSQL